MCVNTEICSLLERNVHGLGDNRKCAEKEAFIIKLSLVEFSIGSIAEGVECIEQFLQGIFQASTCH